MTDRDSPNKKETLSQNSRNISDTEILHTQQLLHEDKNSKPISQSANYEKKLFHILIQANQQLNDQGSKIRYKLSEDARYKLDQTQKEIYKLQKSQNEKKLELSMKELAYNKVLVNTYGFHQYRLVIAHFHIGQAYLNLKCYEQAIEHLGQSLKRNGQYHEHKQAQLYHSQMLASMGQAYFFIQSYSEAIQILSRCLQIKQSILKQSSKIDDIRALKAISKSNSKLGNYTEAIKCAEKCLQKASCLKGQQSIQFIEALINKAQILLQKQQFQQSIKLYKKTINLINQIFPDMQQLLVQLHSQLAAHFLKYGKNEEYLASLSDKYKVLEDAYGYRDKKCIKQKRHFATTLLKMKKLQQAQNELQDILEIQEIVYGQISLQAGKTLKLLGVVNIQKKEWKVAQGYLKRSEKIFHDQGYPNLQKQIKSKLTIVNSHQNMYK